MRIMACCFPLRSHLNTVFGVFSELARRGHELMVVAPEYERAPYCVSVIKQLGASAVSLATPADGSIASVVPNAASWAAMIRDPSIQLWRYEGSFGAMCKTAPRVREIVTDWRPDVIVADPGFYPAAAVAMAHGIPWTSVQTCLSISVPPDIPSNRLLGEDKVRPIREQLFASLGVSSPPAPYLQLLSPDLNIVWHKSTLLGEPRYEHVHLVGPTMTRPHDPDMVPLALDRVPADRRVVYITFGGMVNEDPDVYRRALAACDEIGAYPIVSCPNTVLAELGSAVQCHTTDQLAAIARADVVVGYVGAVTFMEAMYFGKPLVTLPLHSDHPLQSYVIDKVRLGRSIGYHSSPTELARALEMTLDPRGGDASRAAAISVSYREGNADVAAADLVEHSAAA